MKKKECLECGKEFVLKKSWQKFCSKKCRWQNWDKSNPRKRLVQATNDQTVDSKENHDPKH